MGDYETCIRYGDGIQAFGRPACEHACHTSNQPWSVSGHGWFDQNAMEYCAPKIKMFES